MNNSPRPYILAETNWKTVKATDYQLAILPWGATEAHNYHLPYATDNIQNEHIVSAAAKQAWDAGAKVVVLPNIPFGINTGQLDIKLCMNINPSTQLAILKDTVDVVQRAGIKKFVIFNGHGGNHFKVMIRELAFYFPDVFVCALNWFDAADWSEYVEDLGDHAGELETSLMMHFAPQWVLPLSEAGDGATKAYSVKGLRDGWVTSQRQWTKVTKDTGTGNPAKSTADKGKRYADAAVHKIGGFFEELAQTPFENLYEK